MHIYQLFKYTIHNMKMPSLKSRFKALEIVHLNSKLYLSLVSLEKLIVNIQAASICLAVGLLFTDQVVDTSINEVTSTSANCALHGGRSSFPAVPTNVNTYDFNFLNLILDRHVLIFGPIQ